MIEYHVSDGACVLRLNAPPLNTIGLSALEQLRESIRRANSDAGVRGIVVTGDSAHFSAGADVNLLNEISSAKDAVRISRAFQEAFQVVEDSPKPVVAAVAGRVMGGATEFAAACHFRVCTEDTRFSMPEVKLGFNPGAGGTQRLPRLLGAEQALRMMLTGAALGARQALERGFVDAVCRPGELLATARGMLQDNPSPRRTSLRTEKVQDPALNEAAFEKAEKLLAGARPEIMGPAKVVEAVRAGLQGSFEAGLWQEREGFGACLVSPAAQNKIYLFFATRQTSKVPELAGQQPRRLGRAAVVGMGSMGTGIAQALMLAGVPVVVYDEDRAAVDKGLKKIQRSLNKRVEQGRLAAGRAEEMLHLAAPATAWRDLADAELVIEAVFEDLEVKRSVLREIEAVCPAEAILASNTSTISLDALAADMQHAERLIGMHFFNPAQRMPLVEVIRRRATSPGVVATALKFAKHLRKTPVLVNSREGFLVNRLFLPYVKEAFWLLEDGAEPAAVDRAMVEFGFPMGPLELMDLVGLDILVSTDRVMSRAFPRHQALSTIARRLVEQGQLGQKSGAGIYRYDAGDYTPLQSDLADEIIVRARQERGPTPRELSTRQITRRLVLRMVGEAFYVMQEGLAQRASDLDVALVLGIGFPDFRGGVLRYAHDLGRGRVLAELEKLTEQCGERFSPCELLRTTKDQGVQ